MNGWQIVITAEAEVVPGEPTEPDIESKDEDES